MGQHSHWVTEGETEVMWLWMAQPQDLDLGHQLPAAP
jgi:hypothetical protein